MKIAALAFAVLAAFVGVDAKTGVGQPGYCKDEAACTKVAADYTCVSVQTTREGTAEVKQCLPYKQPGDVCAGTTPGLCPSFSTWSKDYKSISSVCAYIIPTAKCAKDNTNSTKGTVQCMNVTSTDEDTYGVIYGCVDYDGSKLLFDTASKSLKMSQAFNYSGIISASCVNPKNAADSDVVCSGRGTCSPNAAGQMDYKCTCNVGYSGTYCQKIDSNKCTQVAQCAAGTCNLVTQQCECEEGTTGDQCAECNPKSTKACNNHGTCGAVSAGTVMAAGSGSSGGSSSGNTTVGSTNSCVCESGYSGAQCDRKVSGTQSNTVSSSNSTTPAPTPNSASSVMASVFVLATSALLAAVLN
uniref:EGF-like domain-containing protein n=1 Tax=Globisporangium ultimum (strain ATCC 200006 / CBS 805.95 / DAOM BR144) TaxID=431595 RepID=K3WV87_GLOUD